VPPVGFKRVVVGLLMGAAALGGGVIYGASHDVFGPSEHVYALTGGLLGTKPAPPPAAASNDPGATSAGVARASNTAFVLDVSGSMSGPAIIPGGYPNAKELKEKEDAVGSLIEQAKSGQKVPLGAVVTGVSAIPRLVQLLNEMNTYLQAQGVDPDSVSKIKALKLSTTSLLGILDAERRGLNMDQQAGLVSFSTSAQELAPLTKNIQGLKTPVDALTADGSTDIGDGLNVALGQVKGRAGANIILLTDGWNNTGMTDEQIISGPVAQAASQGIPICAIGLGTSPFDVDQALLTDIATRTGGAYYFVGDGVSLGGVMAACHHSLGGQELLDFRGSVTQGQTVSAGSFKVPAGKDRLTVTLTWPGSDLDLVLADPSGHQVAAGRLVKAPGLAVATIDRPSTSGNWTARVVGTQTAAAGEHFSVGASTNGATPKRHFDPLVGRNAGASTGPMGEVRGQLRFWLTAAAVLFGILLLLNTLRGLSRRLKTRRLAKRGERLRGGGFATLLLGLGIVLSCIVMLTAFVGDYLWETPLLSLPKF
jgi:uncharacterized protein YegL